jgi:hypothetical protein
MARHTLCILLLGILLLAGGCRSAAGPPSIRVVDFIKEFDRAEQRPAAAYALTEFRARGTSHPSIASPAPGRIIWQVPLPRRGTFHTAVAIDGGVPVRFRIGVSDDRIYEELAAVTVSSAEAWTDLRADLSAYAGWKWSLFYRPERRRWRVVLSTDAVAGQPGRGMWGAPSVSADTNSAREYAQRRAVMR